MIILYDFETTSSDPFTTQPVQLAAIAIDNISKKLYKEDIFCTHIQPYDWNGIDENNDTVIWHAKNRKTDSKSIIDLWKSSPSIDLVWPDFINYCLKFNKNKNKWTAPIACGFNIVNFDNIIAHRMHTLYGKNKPLFHKIHFIDLMNWCWSWMNVDSKIQSFSLDNMRDYFGLSKENAHDAKKDILDCAELLIHFLNLYEKLYPKIVFQGALSKSEM